jgi:hypothetical protein
MYKYRLVFPPAAGYSDVASKTAIIESERPYAVGEKIEFKGRLWEVTETPLDPENLGDYADLMVWPADAPD